MARPGVAVMIVLASAAIGWTVPHLAGQAAADHHQHEQHEHHEHAGAIEAMSQHGHDQDPHIRLTATRAQRPGDKARADRIVSTLRRVLAPYLDSARAERDGYRPFLAALPLPEYHFTNWTYGFLGAFRFNPERPTSLLYRRNGGEYTLSGAMYTAPARATEEQLDERIPVSVGRWHLHVNICLPPEGERRPDLARFGFKGSIASRAACDEAGGRFHPQMFGWMIHVYPFESDPDRIWVH